MLSGTPVLCMMLLAHLVAVEGPLADSVSGKERATPLSYNQDIRPILSNKCFPCHGPDSAARKAGLRLDNAEDAYRDRDGFAAVIPGDIEKSLLVGKIHAENPDDRMPPPESRRSLSAPQRALLVRWIEQGARYEPHWAWQPPLRPDPPTISGDSDP
ncbi:MAG: c-type cytochrome domain-containing protein, partial [Planctomycetota bacterium]